MSATFRVPCSLLACGTDDVLGPCLVAFLADGPARTIALLLRLGLTQPAPLHAPGFRLRLAPVTHIGFVAVDHLLLPV